MARHPQSKVDSSRPEEAPFTVVAPQLNLPKGGGAIRGIGEKFAANPATGTATLSIPIPASASRSGSAPQLSLEYDSGNGNGPFGFGWSLSAPSIMRRTDRGLPRYDDANESDIFILSGAEDLVPILIQGADGLAIETLDSPPSEPGYRIQRYRPRTEGLFARVERWTDKTSGLSHWRSIAPDNVTTLYGTREEARISDPEDATRMFRWLICETRDDHGNAILYRYKPEDDAGIDRSAPQEKNRFPSRGRAERYLKAIRYGNQTPSILGDDLLQRTDWLFEVVFDYGEHDRLLPTTQEVNPWPVRQDPYSRFRSTFEVRTARLCRRVLLFHHFPDELPGNVDYLVRSTDFDYQEGPVASFITAATQAGYVRQADQSYLRKALPKLEFRYTQAELDESVHEVDSASLQNLPEGVDGTRYQWLDLDGEGLSGVLSEQGAGWYYKRSLGNGTLGPSEHVPHRPSMAALSGGAQHLQDVTGDGRLDLVQYGGALAGFQPRTPDGGWGEFVPFKATLKVNVADPNARFIDITGNGHPDLLISEENVFTWYESLAGDGFAAARRTTKHWNEERGPTLVFADSSQSISLADMTGDGLSDIVRVRYSEICYWPNLGFGRFGAKVTMGNSPLLAARDEFDPRRIHLADIDGSGNADLIYIGRDGIALYANQAGNAWGAARVLRSFPRIDNLASITTTDLLGNGTACLVWSSPLPGASGRSLRYIDLMGGQKPHLMVYATNNMGAETLVQFAASTKFYLRDRLEGHPWATRLPFPVHVVERVEKRDLVSNTRLVTTYRYRHGYFDGVEREFRGFAFVEQRDTESVTGDFDLPPVVTRTWFHTGALLEEGSLEAYFKDPANHEFFAGDPQAPFLPDTVLPLDLSGTEVREAARALKGSVLRQETYADDDTAQAGLPYSVSEHSYRLACLQRLGPNRHAVFLNHPAETLTYHYERDVTDPRISHDFTLAVDDYGNILKSLTVGYQRRAPLFAEQGKTLAILTENDYTNAVLQPDAYRTPLLSETRTFELTSPNLTGAKPFDLATMAGLATTAGAIAFESSPVPQDTSKRLLGRYRKLYRKDDLSGFLPVGSVESRALLGESYKQAFTPGTLDLFQANISRTDLSALLTGPQGAYHDLDGDGMLWIASGRTFFSPTPGDSAPAELAFAAAHFSLPHRFEDPFGNRTVVTYDAKYTLQVVHSLDAAGNQTSATVNYRTLQAETIIDANGNTGEVRFDALGLICGTVARGKAAGPVEGDSFDTFTTDLTPDQITQFMLAPDPRALAIAYLGTATTRVLYVLSQIPICACSIARETHVSALSPGQQVNVQLRLVFSDGFGREAQSKGPAAPGPLDPNDPTSAMANPRWVVTGSKIYNNKGLVVRQFEPFFSATAHFGIEQWGVSSTSFFDPAERTVATLYPNHTFEKVIFDPWQEISYDVNDTATLDPKSDPDCGALLRHLTDSAYLPTWYQQRMNGALGPDQQAAAGKAALHANTPSIAHFDGLGRSFLTLDDNGKDANGSPQQYATRSTLDIQGRQLSVADALARQIIRYDHDLLGNRIHQVSMEAGEKWIANDASGKPLCTWNARKFKYRFEYDALRRPARSFASGGDPTETHPTLLPQETLVEHTIYGDSPKSGLTAAQQTQANVRGRPIRHYDGAGVVVTDLYDFKGNTLRTSRQFATNYKSAVDWSVPPQLETDSFATLTTYDALNRVIEVTTPDNSIHRPTYDDAGLLIAFDINSNGAAANGQPVWTPYVTHIEYNAKAQRTSITYGNGATSSYTYESATFRLAHLRTARAAGQNGFAAQIFKDPAVLQDLAYTYDPVGNITRIEDAALLTVFNANQQIDPAADYSYDPLYRLVVARGREHMGQSAFAQVAAAANLRDYPFVGSALQNDPHALQNYIEQYTYDAVGNFAEVAHQSVTSNWTRNYIYSEASALEPARHNNRLSQTMSQAGPTGPTEAYSYDKNGNVIGVSHLPLMQWNFKDQLCATSQQVVAAGTPETTFYAYASDGQRARKVTERANGTRKCERFYVGGFEIYREFSSGSAVALERLTLQVMDDKRRIALIETETVNTNASAGTLGPVARYQLGNHIGSATLELDAASGVITYEEYYPYGTTSFQAGRAIAELSLKRHRYSAKERDEETGFDYFGARYYMPWLGRWTAPEPGGLTAGTNLYQFVDGQPVNNEELNGFGWRDAAKGFGKGLVGGIIVGALIASAPISGTALLVIGAGGVALTAYGAYKTNQNFKSGKITAEQRDEQYGELGGGLVGGALGGGAVGGLKGGGGDALVAAGEGLLDRIPAIRVPGLEPVPAGPGGFGGFVDPVPPPLIPPSTGGGAISAPVIAGAAADGALAGTPAGGGLVGASHAMASTGGGGGGGGRQSNDDNRPPSTPSTAPKPAKAPPPEGAPAPKPKVNVKTGPYKGSKGQLPKGQQANHLNQNAAFRDVIPKGEGESVAMQGNAFTEPGSPHYEFHRSLETFWDQFRPGGARSGELPTNAEYDAALKQALEAGKFTSEEAAEIAAQAAKQRAQYGLGPNDPVPRIPGKLGQVKPP